MKDRVRSLLYVLITLCVTTPALLAQSEADIKNHIAGRLLYFSGLWASNKLIFSSDGHLQGDSKPTSFTLSGVQIRKVQLKGDRLLLEGDRYGLRVRKADVQPINLSDRVRIEVATPASGNFYTRLDEILVPEVDDLLPKIPRQLQTAAKQFFLHGGFRESPVATSSVAGTAIRKVGGEITAPVLTRQVDPQFSSAAHNQKLGGKVVVSCHVEEDGKPSHVEVTQPAGLGLDEQAIFAVSQYEFKPARYKGQPIVVELHIEVEFEMF